MKAMRMMVAVLVSIAASMATAADGLVSQKSAQSVQSTMDKLETLVKARGFTVFARIDHAAGAAKVGKLLRPTQLLVFGNPEGGTPFMECAQTAGIDLPLKALVWEDAQAQVWLGFNDPGYLAKRHGASECAVVNNMRKTLDGLAAEAVAR